MKTFDLVFETYVKSIIDNAFLPFTNEFYYINNFKPEYIDNEQDMDKYLVIYNEGALTRIHRDFVESGTKAYFINFLTPVIQGEYGLKYYKEQLESFADKLRFEDTEIQDEDGTPLFTVTSIVGDVDPIEKITQNGVRYLFTIDVSCTYNSEQQEEGKIIPVREEQRLLQISLDGGVTYQDVKGKLAFQKGHSSDLNIFPTNGERVAQNYLKQRRKTHTLQVQRGTTGVAEELYQLYEDSDGSVNNIKIKCKDYPSAPTREYLATLTQAVESGEYSLFTALVFTFEVKQVTRVRD